MRKLINTVDIGLVHSSTNPSEVSCIYISSSPPQREHSQHQMPHKTSAHCVYSTDQLLSVEVFSQGTSLVVQWLRIHLPVQGTQVRALVREDPTCRRATKPVRHNYRACALEPASHNY